MTTGQLDPSQGKKPAYDHLLKWSLTKAHDDLLALIAPGTTWQGERSPEVPAIPRLADLVWEVILAAGHRGLLHIELQTKVEDDLGERLAEYAIHLWRRDHLPVRSVVILLRKTSKAPASPFVIRWNEEESLRYSFQVIRLWEIPYEQVLTTTTHAFWSLATLTEPTTIETAIEVAQRLAEAPISRQEKCNLIGLTAGLAGLNLPREAVLAASRRNPVIDELLRESGVIELLREELRGESRQEAQEQSIAKGERRVRAVSQSSRWRAALVR